MRDDYEKMAFAKFTRPIMKGVTTMKKKVNPIYKLIFAYHLQMIEVCNIRQCLGLISDDKAEKSNMKHTMGAIRTAYFGGFATKQVESLMKEES